MIMANKYDNVIVFGPTGAVGSAVAQEASKRGAKVWLAMRDTSKKIPDLSESGGSFERIQADLSDTDSITKAVKESKAKAAFFYLLHHAQDGMKAAIQAMKDGGIEYAVFLSSYTIPPEESLASVKPEAFIPYMHARVELSLEEVGVAHTALRPGYFAYNIFRNFIDGSQKDWEIKTMTKTFKGDCIVPSDIGKVGGAVLVDRPLQSNKEIVYVYGPEILTLAEQVDVIKKVTGRNVTITIESAEDHRQTLTKNGLPPPIIGYFIKVLSMSEAEQKRSFPQYETAKDNVKKYSGHEPTTFEEFVKVYKP